MAEKRVSVRLAAEGGRLVKAEFQGVGNAGEASFARISAGAERMNRMLVRVSGLLAGAFSIRALSHAADDWSDMQSKVGAAIKDMDRAPETMRRLVDVANASYSSLGQTVEAYSRNVAVLREMGRSSDEAADFTEALNHALVVTATKGEQAAAVQNALSKAMAVGKLSGLGLETILNSGGRVAEALARKLGVSTLALRKMAADGKITSDVIAEALIGSLEELREEADKMPPTIADGFQRIGTGLTAVVGQMDQALGASAGLASGLVAIGDALKSIADWDWANVAARSLDVLLLSVTALAIGRIPVLIAGISTLTNTFAVGTAAVWGYNAALAALGRASALLGGPIGIAMTAIALIGVTFYRTRQDVAALEESFTGLQDTQAALAKASADFAAQMTLDSAQMRKVAAENAVAAARDALATWQRELDNASFRTNFFGFSLYETERMAAAKAQIEELRLAIFDLTGQVQLADHAIITLGADGGARAAVADDVQKLIDGYAQSARLLQLEAQYGRASIPVIAEKARQEQVALAARLESLNATVRDQRLAMDALATHQRAANAATVWGQAVDAVKVKLGEARTALIALRDAEPGSGWLDAAIRKAAALAATLWDAARATFAGSPLALTESSRPLPKPFELGVSDLPKPGTGGAGGASSAASDRKAALDALVSELRTERETIAAWYLEKQRIINSATDLELAALGGKHNALERLEVEHQERMRAIQDDSIGSWLNTYAAEAAEISKGIGDALQNAFQSAESAFRSFVTHGKADFRGLVSSILADLATLAFKQSVLGPIANALSGALGSLGRDPLSAALAAAGAPIGAGIFHTGGVVGAGGLSRTVPALAFVGAPRMHKGGWAGLKPDEVPAILQRGERVLSRRDAATYGAGGDMVINVNVDGATGDRHVMALVSEGVRRGLSQYDKALPGRIRGISERDR